jgi:hypothetical protein
MLTSKHYLSQLLLGTSVLFALSSCSLFSGPSSTSLALDGDGDAGWKEIQQSPYVYEVSDGDAGKAYITAIKECEKKKAVSPIVAARQLLVGLKDIRIVSQDQLNVADLPALRSHITARLEEHPLDLLTYTVPHKDCVYDIVLWRATPQGAPAQAAQFFGDDERLAQFLTKNLPGLLQ